MIGFSQTEVTSPGDAITSAASRPIVSQRKVSNGEQSNHEISRVLDFRSARSAFGDRPSRLAQPSASR
jgi:hypothetical protein